MPQGTQRLGRRRRRFETAHEPPASPLFGFARLRLAARWRPGHSDPAGPSLRASLARRPAHAPRRALVGMLPRHGARERALPEPRRRLPLPRDRPPRARLPAGEPRREADPPRHRRRGAAARPRRDRGAADARWTSSPRPPASAATRRTRATTSCSRRSARTTTARAASRSRPTRSSSPTAASRTRATSRRSSARTARSLVSDPVYPVYVDTNVMAGRAGKADGAGRHAGHPLPRRRTRRTASRPTRPRSAPTSPTSARRTTRPGSVLDKRAARALGGVGARERRRPGLRRRLRRLHRRPGAPALDLRDRRARAPARSRCGASASAPASRASAARTRWYRRSAPARRAAGERVPLRELWARRMSTKFNGVPYLVQRAAEAVLLPEGQQAGRRAGRLLPRERAAARARVSPRPASACSAACTLPTSGCAPRAASRPGTSSIACSPRPTWSRRRAPASAPAGEGYFRLSAFNSRENIEEALARIDRVFGRR